MPETIIVCGRGRVKKKEKKSYQVPAREMQIYEIVLRSEGKMLVRKGYG